MQVYLCDGQVIDLPANARMTLGATQLLFTVGRKTIARFRRNDVFYCSREPSCASPT